MPTFFVGNMGGVTRLRTARPGFDASDPGLDPRYLSFDSQWLNSFRMVASGVTPAAFLPNSYYDDGGLVSVPSRYDYLRVDVPTANRAIYATNRQGAGSRSFSDVSGGSPSPVPYAQSYKSNYVTLMGDHFRIPRGGGFPVPPGDIMYWAFQSTPTAPEPSGSNGMIFGNHATRGPGIYISRPGTDPLTAADGDMMLSTQTNHFQIAESGVAGPATTYSYANRSFTTVATLANSYPSYPPVMYYCANPLVGRIRQPTCYWLSPNQLAFTHEEPSSAPGGGGGFYVRFAIIASDPAYDPTGLDSGSFLRCYASPATGFGVTKKNVHATSAGAEDWIFRSDRASFYFNGFDSIGLGRAAANYNSPVATVGLPFSFFTLPDASPSGIVGSLHGLAFDTTHWRGPYSGADPTIVERHRFAVSTISGSQYNWWQDGYFPGGVGGTIATVNVSDV